MFSLTLDPIEARKFKPQMTADECGFENIFGPAGGQRSNVDRTNSIDELTFKLEAFEDRENK